MTQTQNAMAQDLTGAARKYQPISPPERTSADFLFGLFTFYSMNHIVMLCGGSRFSFGGYRSGPKYGVKRLGVLRQDLTQSPNRSFDPLHPGLLQADRYLRDRFSFRYSFICSLFVCLLSPRCSIVNSQYAGACGSDDNPRVGYVGLKYPRTLTVTHSTVNPPFSLL